MWFETQKYLMWLLSSLAHQTVHNYRAEEQSGHMSQISVARCVQRVLVWLARPSLVGNTGGWWGRDGLASQISLASWLVLTFQLSCRGRCEVVNQCHSCGAMTVVWLASAPARRSLTCQSTMTAGADATATVRMLLPIMSCHWQIQALYCPVL